MHVYEKNIQKYSMDLHDFDIKKFLHTSIFYIYIYNINTAQPQKKSLFGFK